MNDLPRGWTTAAIRQLCSLENGRAFKPTDWTEHGLPIVRIQNLNREGAAFNRFAGDVAERYRLRGGELLFAWSGTPGTSFGAHVWRGGDAVLNQHIFRVDFDEAFVDKRFFRHAINQKLEELINVAHGGVGLRHVTKGVFENTEVLVPPLPEQKRIADKLDALLARVDACRERIDRAHGILKRFRQSVLAAATSGELTREWREERHREPHASKLLSQISEERRRRGLPSGTRSVDIEGVDAAQEPLPDTWTWCRVGQIADVRLGGTPARHEAAYWNGDVPWVSSGEVANSRISDTSEKITRTGLVNSNAKLYPPGTVLIAMIGEGKTRGQSALLEIGAATNQNVAGLVFETDLIDPEYVWFWALSQYERTRRVGRGGNQPALNGAKVRGLPLPLPPTAEQREIVERVRGLLSLADQASMRLDAAAHVASRMTSALLAEAFRGALVPQDPNDEPASALLARLATPPAVGTRSTVETRPRRGGRTTRR